MKAPTADDLLGRQQSTLYLFRSYGSPPVPGLRTSWEPGRGRTGNKELE